MSDLTGDLTEEDRRILEEARRELRGAETPQALEAVRIKYLGRKGGVVQKRFELLNLAPPEERPRLGKSANALKRAVEGELIAAGAGIELDRSEEARPFDLTLPGRRGGLGHRHVLSQTEELLADVAASLGFSVVEGPEVETEEHNFDALNIPLEHPSHDPYDTFYVETGPEGGKLLLRSHTSPVQVRVMREATGSGTVRDPAPVRVVVPGRVYRPDKVDATHYHTFHQLEGLAVDKDITFADLKYTLELLARGVFGEAVRARFRPSFFPFTEPSAEMDISCPFCAGERLCPVCKGTGWIEILGCGMVHPKVLRDGGYDPEAFTGFAFGMGIERIAMLRHGIRDIRLFIDPERGNDLRFLEQF